MTNEAGKSLKKMRKRVLKLSFKNFIIGSIIFIVGVILVTQKVSFLKSLGGFTMVLSLIYYIFGNFQLNKVDRIDYGYKGEIDVAKVLNELPKDFKVINDINVEDKFNIDHLVIGPTGVFVIETKNHKGVITNIGDTLLINNRLFEKDIIKQTLDESYYIKDKIKSSLNLNIFVKPVIVFANPKAYVKSYEVKGVKTISIRMLKSYLLNQKTKIDSDYIEKIYNLFKNF
ncbi:MAG: nuclease-related domain-containing protein [Caldisericia bacterium]|nr:nuclease-related domain-containing protein [Caldisericia bacterium]